jgi:hypothetical protein
MLREWNLSGTIGLCSEFSSVSGKSCTDFELFVPHCSHLNVRSFHPFFGYIHFTSKTEKTLCTEVVRNHQFLIQNFFRNRKKWNRFRGIPQKLFDNYETKSKLVLCCVFWYTSSALEFVHASWMKLVRNHWIMLGNFVRERQKLHRFWVIRSTLFASKRTLFPPIFLDTYISLLKWKKLCARKLSGIINLFYKTSLVIEKSGTDFELFHKNCLMTMKLKVS